VENQVRLMDGGINLIDRQSKSAVDVGIRRSVKPDMAIADLNESEVGGFSRVRLSAEDSRTRYSAGERP